MVIGTSSLCFENQPDLSAAAKISKPEGSPAATEAVAGSVRGEEVGVYRKPQVDIEVRGDVEQEGKLEADLGRQPVYFVKLIPLDAPNLVQKVLRRTG